VAQDYAVMTINKEELAEVILENLGGEMSLSDLDSVRVPTAGGTTWVIPDVENGDRSEKVLRGIVVFQTATRGYWEDSFEATGGGTPPTCYSKDGKTGIGNPGTSCGTCPLNQWESDRRGGKGKACREMRHMFMLQGDSLLPLKAVMPPTSVKAAHQYFVRLASRGIPYYAVMTEVTLEQTRWQ
jgi:hypothetical protein